MTSIDELPDIQREVLRLCYFSPDQRGEHDELKARIYYPDADIEQAIQSLLNARHLTFCVSRDGMEPTVVHYEPSRAMMEQMEGLRWTADARLREELRTIHARIQAEMDDDA